VKFAGFLSVYQEDRDDPTGEEDDSGRRLPDLKANDNVKAGEVKPEQHFTQPPPRFSEASLIKRLEELGIGRPSTYTSILQTLEDRNYVRFEKKRLIPEDRGRIVTAFLTNFFDRYVEYGFTADLEEKLDDISGGRAQWKDVLRDFWLDFSRLHQPANDQDGSMPSMDDAVSFLDTGIGKRSAVIDVLNETLAPHFFPPAADGRDTRICPACKNGQLGIKLGKTGGFIGCSNYPECRYTRPLAVANGEENELTGPVELGVDPKSGKKATLRKGPYGHYVQLDEEGDEKPKRVSLPRGVTLDQVTLPLALGLLALPRVVGEHPETKKPIMAGIGRFGPYLQHDGKYKSIPKDDDVLTIGLNRAVDLLAQESKGRGGRAAPGKPIGNHPEDSQPVTLHDGRYGHYVKWGKVNATIPKDIAPESVTLEQAIGLIADRVAKGGGGGGRFKKAAKKAAKPELSEGAPKDVKPKAAKKAAKPKAEKKAAPKAAKKAAKKSAE
jgi:DNA topoisomerase-1